MTVKNPQRIDRLTPLAEVLSKLRAFVKPVAPIELHLDECVGLALAGDLISPRANPAFAVALRDGWAVRAEALDGAGAYAPLPLNPAPNWVNAGDRLPAGADSVAPFDAIAFAGEAARAVAQVFPGENILQPGDLARDGAILRPSGSRLRATDVAAAALSGVERAKVRKPRIVLAQGGAGNADATLSFLARAIATRGGSAEISSAALDKCLAGEIKCDALIAVGGTGMGRNDDAVSKLKSSGEVIVHGVAVAPGDTAALGRAQGTPVLLLPGRFDATLATWLLIGHPLLDALAASADREATMPVKLARKIASAPGIAEIVPLRCEDGRATPLASGVLSLEALGNAHGWVLVPPESEGFAPGASIEMRLLP